MHPALAACPLDLANQQHDDGMVRPIVALWPRPRKMKRQYLFEERPPEPLLDPQHQADDLRQCRLEAVRCAQKPGELGRDARFLAGLQFEFEQYVALGREMEEEGAMGDA